jgi:hypothetical protein
MEGSRGADLLCLESIGPFQSCFLCRFGLLLVTYNVRGMDLSGIPDCFCVDFGGIVNVVDACGWRFQKLDGFGLV